MKRTTASQRILALLILLSATISTFAYDIQDGRLYYNLNTAKQEATVTFGPTKPTGKITIPSSVTYNGTRYYVTAIEAGAFQDCTELTRVDGLDQVKTIGVFAFENCTKLTYIHLSSRLTSIGAMAFYQCPSLTEIIIPDNVIEIGNLSFYGCSSLSSVKLGKGVTSIGNAAFTNCTSLIEITIPDKVTEIGESTFNGCSSLSSVKFGKGVTSIGKNAFKSCKNLTNANIPNSVVSIGSSAFADCTQLKTLCIPNNITCIEPFTFDYCGFEALAIPNSVTSIKEYALGNGFNLTSIYCLATTPPTVEDNFINSPYISIVTLYVPAGTVAAYKNAYGWKDIPRIEEINLDEISDINSLRTIAKSGSGLKGDVNGDNQVNISDVTTLVNIILNKQ